MRKRRRKKTYYCIEDIWETIHQMSNHEQWEETTWTLAKMVNVEYERGDEYKDIITILTFGLIDSLV